MNLRLLFSDNGTITDYSKNVHDYGKTSQAVSFKPSEDAFYLGAYWPFNSKFFKFTTAFLSSLVPVKVEYWTGSSGWKEAVEVIDETDGLTSSGFISWNPDKDFGWMRDDTDMVADLTTVVIYDLFWMKMTLDASITADVTASLSYVGELFSDDRVLAYEYPDLVRAQTLSSFKIGKTDWEEQHILATKIILDELRAKKVITFKEQILDRREFELASVSKCAEIIYSSFGLDFADYKDKAYLEYKKRMNKDIFNVDKNQTAQVNPQTLSSRQGYFTR